MKYGTFVEVSGELRDQLEFVARARAKHLLRPSLLHILIEPSEVDGGIYKAVASDGQRLHIVDPLSCGDDTGIEPGLWRFLKQDNKTLWMAKIEDTDILPFPNYRKVLPVDAPLFSTTFSPKYKRSLSANNIAGFLRETIVFLARFPKPTAIDPKFLSDLTMLQWDVAWHGNQKYVVFEHRPYKTVIMPMAVYECDGEIVEGENNG